MGAPSQLRLSRRLALLALILVPFAWAVGCFYYALSPVELLKQGARVLLAPVYAVVYADDQRHVAEITRRYWIGMGPLTSGDAAASWGRVQQAMPGFHLTADSDASQAEPSIPFVYEQPDAEYLRRLREHFRLDDIVSGAPDEYGAMLRLAGWLGTRWDHGTDAVPGGSKVCEPVEVIEDGQRGAHYWCEIAARTTVQTATALGWPARVITASRDGYTWEHAIAELWSNQFDKWFVVDTDFNVVYEHDGVPLSAFELSTQGEALQRAGKLATRPIAPPKRSLPLKNMVPFYKYVHVDLRNDWCSRPLPRASPAGGDLATWWTARPTMPRILTAKTRVDDPAVFDWKVNRVEIYAAGARRLDDGGVTVEAAFKAYSPMFQALQVSVDDGDWQDVAGTTRSLSFAPGAHTIRARVRTISNGTGPLAQVAFGMSTADRAQLTSR